MSETFEEYLVNSPHINNHTITTLDESQMWEIERCWNHQQKKIDEKDTLIAELEKKVAELSWDGALNRAEERIAELEAENILKGTTDQEYKKMLLSKNKTIKRGFEINKQLASAVIDLDNNENIDQETIELAKQILEGK